MSHQLLCSLAMDCGIASIKFYRKHNLLLIVQKVQECDAIVDAMKYQMPG